MDDVTTIQIERDEELGLTVWLDGNKHTVAIGLDASWYVRTVVSLPVELSKRELDAQVCEELQIQFATDASDWYFDFVALDEAPSLDGLCAWEIFALASQRMVSIRKLCDEKQWRLMCSAQLHLHCDRINRH